MATQANFRSIVFSNRHQALLSLFSRSLTTVPASAARSHTSSPAALPPLLRRALLCPLSSVVFQVRPTIGVAVQRRFSTRTTSSSLRDTNPNWSNRPPKETILLDGCDFEHWLIVMEKPEGDPTRDEIIDYYIKTLAQVVGSEEEARMKIYSVSHRCYYAFGALVSEEVSNKIKELPKVRWVLPDSYLDVKNKDYGGEPFINGQAVPYDPKYHEEWIKNNARAMERNRRNDRPKNFDRSRNFERRRENREFQNQSFQNNMPNGPPQGSQGGMPPNNMGPTTPGHPGGMQPNPQGVTPPSLQSGMPPNYQGGTPPNYQGGTPQNFRGGTPQSYQGGTPPNYQGGTPPNYHQGGMPPNYQGMQQNYPGGMPPNNFSGFPPNNQPRMPSNNMTGGMGGPPPNGRAMQSPNSPGNVSPPQQNYMGGTPQNNFAGPPPQGSMVGQQNGGAFPPNQGWVNTAPQRDPVNFTPTRDPSTGPSNH
ncbi:hypothetical protein MLD38_034165 [Melastoma candidum]|uniref:Uncharacterized protein n=2 Tax=Melastoma candidum TaxID=119954 RepID=A0ACB9MAF8_9MYRT|nr:hypothetical protein MLD38_034165 [Melastoma candidum]